MNYFKALIIIFAFSILFSSAAFAQTTEFSYQGNLQNGGIPANGSFDFEFVLFDALAAGIQLGQISAINNVAVTNGIFAVRLDFGNQFSGANRFLEIRVRPAGQPGITILSPRQSITSTPYSIKSLTAENAVNAATAVTATNFTGSLAGNVSGTQGATVVNTVGGQTAANVANAVLAVNSATQASVPNTLVMRNATGDFAADTIVAQQYNIGISRVLGINGSNNIFVGVNAGLSNSGANNSFFGNSAGSANTTGSNNTIIGRTANVGSGGLSFATALGAGAIVSSNNTVVLGREDDQVIARGRLVASDILDVVGDARFLGLVTIFDLGAAGAGPLCRNVNDHISSCSSSLRYKTDIKPFSPGLALVNRLRPITFNWKDGGMLDMGLVAEEVAEVEPLLVTTNKKGEIEGVKYDRVGVVLINAVTEQQSQIESQQKKIDEQRELIHKQQSEINEMKAFICLQNPTAVFCQEKKP